MRSWSRGMGDLLDELAYSTWKRIRDGYYDIPKTILTTRRDLRKAIVECKNIPIIAEVKFASPAHGTIRHRTDPSLIAKAMERGGAVAISVLTEPEHFNGSLESLELIRKAVSVPILMKDIVLSKKQVDAAAALGADAVLLIMTIFTRGYGETSLGDMMEYIGKKGLQTLLEVHTEHELMAALQTKAELIGINNRDLTTMQVDLSVSERLLKKVDVKDKIIISESGIAHPQHIARLRKLGVNAFLVGASIMQADDIEAKVRELVTPA